MKRPLGTIAFILEIPMAADSGVIRAIIRTTLRRRQLWRANKLQAQSILQLALEATESRYQPFQQTSIICLASTIKSHFLIEPPVPLKQLAQASPRPPLALRSAHHCGSFLSPPRSSATDVKSANRIQLRTVAGITLFTRENQTAEIGATNVVSTTTNARRKRSQSLKKPRG